jgi:hypothetical protein
VAVIGPGLAPVRVAAVGLAVARVAVDSREVVDTPEAVSQAVAAAVTRAAGVLVVAAIIEFLPAEIGTGSLFLR